MLLSDNQRKYRYLHLLSMAYIMLMLCDAVLVYKFIKMPFGYGEACIFITPLWLIISDIITEVYGFKTARQVLVSAIICYAIFTLLAYTFIQLPSPEQSVHLQASYDLILGHLPQILLASIAAIFISGYINMLCISKWKIRFKGKYFWLRSLGASWIGALIYTVIAITLMLYPGQHISYTAISIAIMWSYLSKIILTLILSGPGALLAHWLNIKEESPINRTGFNPFSTREQLLKVRKGDETLQ